MARAFVLALVPLLASPGHSQNHSSAPPVPSLVAWRGLEVASIQFEGIPEDWLKPLPQQLAQQPGKPLDPDNVRESLRRLYATGLYQTIEVSGIRAGDRVTLIFSGTPQIFLRRVNLEGIHEFRLTSVVQGSTQLQAGTPFSEDKVPTANDLVQGALEDNGFYRGQIATTQVFDPANSLVDLNYIVTTGPPARVGEVDVSGDSGLTNQQFRKQGKLKRNSKVNRNTVSRALRRLRKHYDKDGHLAATVSLTSRQYQEPVNRLNYNFLAHRGPVVTVKLEGARIGKSKLKQLVPVYEEGAVDQDLLNEGAQNLKTYYQGRGYFDVQVGHRPVRSDPTHVTALYTVDLGRRHVIDSVKVVGNRYFGQQTLLERLQVHAANLVDRQGIFSQQLVNQDVTGIKGLYLSNGFSGVTVTPKITDSDTGRGSKKEAHLNVVYVIDEGAQRLVEKYRIEGATSEQMAQFQSQLSSAVGQPYSPLSLNQDRDMVLTYYYSEGYDNADVNLFQQPEPWPDRIDLTMKIVPGNRTFVRSVLISGIKHTRPSVVDNRILVHPGEPLNQTALLQTQRKLYDLGLFSEVDTAVQNPDGDVPYKSVLVNLTEARRWDINYGFGLEAQTGQPSQGCLSPADQVLLGIVNSYKCNPNGRFEASPRILFDVSRTNLRGTAQSITLRTNYGTLEQIAMLSYQDPQVFHRQNLSLTLSGGYNNSAIISTYQAAILSGSLRISQQASKANTLIYSYSYRRVSVNSATLQVSLAEIPLLAQPVRVGGPGISWIRDTRDVPLDAHHGSLTTAEQFLAGSYIGSQANFNRIDFTNSTYYAFARDQWVFARETRYGQERAFGDGLEQLIPLPERLYAGGSTSHRGFAINAAGPRDPQTGYPVGGAGVFVNSLELRSPPPELPYLGRSLSFVLFHDMGNAFETSSQVWSSALRIKQPHSYTCHNLSKPYPAYNTPDTCDFNDFSHALGLGLRYKTPIGPVRGDFSYNLNPPIFPVFYNYTTNTVTPNPYVGQASHFNVFFSIGQSF